MMIQPRFSVGDYVYFVDVFVEAPVGPARIVAMRIYDEPVRAPPFVVYEFGMCAIRREDEVFASHDEALKRARDEQWLADKRKKNEAACKASERSQFTPEAHGFFSPFNLR